MVIIFARAFSLTLHHMSSHFSPETDNAGAFLSEIYGKDVFNLKTMERYLSREAYKKLIATHHKGHKLYPTIANYVAAAIKLWAM